jgi:hypothetical protein
MEVIQTDCAKLTAIQLTVRKPFGSNPLGPVMPCNRAKNKKMMSYVYGCF